MYFSLFFKLILELWMYFPMTLSLFMYISYLGPSYFIADSDNLIANDM